MYYKVASIVLNSEQKTSTASDIFIAQPDSYKETLAGKLFILIEIESTRADALKLSNFLINTLNYNYYQNEKIILRENNSGIKIETIFQDCLSKTNQALVDFLEQEKIKISPYAFNVNVAVISEDELHFSSVGKHKNLLIYKEKNSAVDKVDNKTFEPKLPEYKISNVGTDNTTRTEAVNINKLFSDISSGRIPGNGYFLMINEALAEYISNKQLLKIVTKLSPAGAAEQIKNTLSQINAYVSFLGIIIKNSTSNELTHEDIKKEMEEKNNRYSNKITSLEEETEKIMAPAGAVDFKKIIKTIADKVNPAQLWHNTPGLAADQPKKIFVFQDYVFFKRRKNLLKNIQILSRNIWRNTRGVLAVIFNYTVNKTEGSEPGISPLKRLKILLSRKEQEGGLKKRNKVILSLAIIFLIIFAGNLYNQNRKNQLIAEQQALEATIAEIANNQNKIDANLLYNNETDAKRLIAETRNHISEIVNNPKYGPDKITDILAKENEQINTIRKIVSLKLDKKIADFSILNSEASPENIILNNDKIYLADAGQKTIYQVDLNEEINTANNHLPEGIAQLNYPAANDDTVYYFNQDSIIMISDDNTISKAEVNLPDNETILSMATFNNNLYFLSDKQIYRTRQSGANFQELQTWLSNEADASGGINLSIDGFIYILKQDGSVTQFLRGAKQDFALDSLYQPIVNADKIINSDQHIYISELSAKRLVVFDKEGKFIKQYIINTDQAINDIVVDEDQQKLYILSGTSVFEIDIPSEQ